MIFDLNLEGVVKTLDVDIGRSFDDWITVFSQCYLLALVLVIFIFPNSRIIPEGGIERLVIFIFIYEIEGVSV
jgi:hypothetical protein